MTNDKRVIENLRAHYQEIISSYVITAYATSCHGLVSGAVCAPPLLSLNAIKNIVKSFPNTSCDLYPSIIKYCEEKDIAENKLYKKAHVSKTVFSKIRSMKDTGYKPSKSTILCLCLALELNNKETEEMLNIAGYSLSDDIIADKIVSYCISKRYYDVYDIETLILEKTGGVYLYS
ncbi:hypothetical protein [Phascolarctobacterium succinatutens]|uniref:hypothetical protein n=1 Tax=Phascolarctobacterium succinatutens TaxID=626940 RepID=UPI0025F4CF36|nr:hypothetical protein [Phascolarctobacterium succinatutens]